MTHMLILRHEVGMFYTMSALSQLKRVYSFLKKLTRQWSENSFNLLRAKVALRQVNNFPFASDKIILFSVS